MYATALYGGLIVAFIGLIGIAMEKRDIQVLILTDIVGLAMLIVVAAVGTDLSEALILPGLVVELAEIMAISEILISREMRKADKDTSFAPLPLDIDMEIMTTAPNFTISGMSWCLWIIGFLLFFLLPQYWLLSLFLAALGLLLKVASKIGLIGIMMREEYGRK